MAVLKYKDPTSGEWKSLSGYIYLGNDIPVGAICNYSGDNIPDDYLLCDGSSLLRSAYPDLFNVIGTKYGSVDVLHFNLPDLRERTTVGKSGNSPYNTLGNKGGEATHVLTIAEMPSHDHPVTGAITSNSTLYMQNIASNYYANGSPTLGNTSLSTWQWSKSIVAQGGNQAHNNMQPYMVLNYIIKAKNSTYTLSKVVNSLDSDSTTDSLSAAQGKILNDMLTPVSLYDNASGTQGTITLSDSASNYQFLIINFRRDTGYFSARVDNPNGRQITVPTTFYQEGNPNNMYVYSSKLGFNNNTVTYIYHGLAHLPSGGTVSVGNDDNVKVVKILGYK